MLELYHITKHYNGQILFEDLNLKIEGPTMLGIHGVSGVGKTTLLNIIGGVDSDYRGAVRFNGINIKKNSETYRLLHVCFLYQHFSLLSKWSIKDNLNLYSYLSHRKSGVNEKELLSKLNLHEKNNKKCGQLSGGQQQRYALIRGLKKEPSIILCDEPTSALDQENAQHLMQLLKEYALKAIVIVVSHDVHILNQYCDKTVCLYEGKIDNQHISSTKRLLPKEKAKKRSPLLDYFILLKEMFKNQRERHLLSIFAIMFGTLCLMVSLVVSFCLRQETYKEIKKLFPQQCISLKYQNREWLNEADATTLINAHEQVLGGYLNIPYVEFLGLGKETGDLFYIGDNTRCINDTLRLSQGRLPENEHEILLSKNTYQRLFGEETGSQSIYGYYQYSGQQKRTALQVVGIVDEYTNMDTIYRLSLSELKIIQRLFDLSEVSGDYLMLYCQDNVKEMIAYLEENYPKYEYKEVGADLSQSIGDVLEKISYFLYILTFIMLCCICLLLIMTIYLNITEKLKEIGLFRMLGASKKQILYLQILDILLTSIIGSSLGVFLVSTILKQLNTAISGTLGFSLITALPISWQGGIILFMSILGGISSIFPIGLLSRLSLIDCLKDQGY